jgi:hypothetical protein
MHYLRDLDGLSDTDRDKAVKSSICLIKLLAIAWKLNGLDTTRCVVNCSWSVSSDKISDTFILRDLVKRMSSFVPFVCAAGNNHKNIDDDPTAPADMKEVITVGALNTKDSRWEFSNFGNATDIYAPGTDIEFNDLTGEHVIKKEYGTSLATPLVSGIIACMISENKKLPNPIKLGPTEIKTKLLANAKDVYGLKMLTVNFDK